MKSFYTHKKASSSSMKMTSYVDEIFYPYKIEKYDINNDSWSFYKGFRNLKSAKRFFHNDLFTFDKGVFRLISTIELGGR